jgi:hypothetical protein
MVEHGNRFLFGDNSFLFVAAVNIEEKNQVKLMISRDNDTDLTFDVITLTHSPLHSTHFHIDLYVCLYNM